MSSHLHLYYCAWTNESRAWRAGDSALRHGLAEKVLYVGYRVASLSDKEEICVQQSIHRIGSEPVAPGRSRWLRAASLPRWWLACLREIDLSDVTLIVAHSLAALPAGVALKAKYGIPLVYDAHELETERAGWSLPVRKISRLFERALIRNCDQVMVVSNAIRDWYLVQYPGLPVTTVRNISDSTPPVGKSPLREQISIGNDVLLYTYCGAITRGRGLEELVDVFRELETTHAIVFIGNGAADDELRQKAIGAKNIFFKDAVPVNDLVTLMSGADVGVFVPSSLSLSYQYCLPNKVFEYAAAGLPMLLGEGPELASFAENYQAARTTGINRECLKEAIKAWSIDDVRGARLGITYKPPTWHDEESRLLGVFGQAMMLEAK